MALEGKISKALLVVKSAAATPSTTQAIRYKLYESGFIVVREEYRTVNAEVASKLVQFGLETSDVAANLTGDVYLFVVACSDAAEKLIAFSAAEEHSAIAEVSTVSKKPLAASKAVSLLFPKMATDNIPSNGEAREYVQEELKGLLLSGLSELAKQKPKNPIEWLAHYLLENNPNSPPVTFN